MSASPIEPVIPAENAIDVVKPAFIAELELWSAARTDAKLREVLRREEQQAHGDLYRVAAEAFGPELVESPAIR